MLVADSALYSPRAARAAVKFTSYQKAYALDCGDKHAIGEP
jgi:hypothetical protein